MAYKRGKTRKLSHKKATGIFSIPELRRSFEHIEEFMDECINSRSSKEEIVKDLQKEWKKTFLKELDYESAESYVDHIMKSKKDRRKTMKRYKGGMAPLDYTTRAGIYLQPAAIPPHTQFPVLNYVSKGFFNPEPAHLLDPVPGQTRFPTSVPAGMGDNTVHFKGHGGKRSTNKRSTNKRSNNKRGTRKLRGGMAALNQAFMRPIPSSNPPTILQDLQSGIKGLPLGQSPDITQNSVPYKLGAIMPKLIKLDTTF